MGGGSVKENFYLTCDFLHHCAKAGVVFNWSKFQFCETEVEYVGFVVGDAGVRPTGDMLKSIKEFPRPQDLTGVRAFFGLVEQVAWAFTKHKAMAPFRELLKSKSPFLWSQELQVSFEAARQEITRQVEQGVTAFEVGRRTAMVTDWSKTGIAAVILQKHCSCEARGTVRCCETGWKVCFTGSRFCAEAESRYSPVEGEALAVAWGLKKGKYFLEGCQDLEIGVDHKPLLGLYNPERPLADIENARLRRLVEKAVQYRFTAFHVPGKDNLIADGLSRSPVGEAVQL